MRIGIFGGTFNPIHNGHLIIAEEAGKALNLDRVVFVPSYINPLKQRGNLASAGERLVMVKKAAGSRRYFSVSDYEIKSRRSSFTIDTLREFRRRYPRARLFFLTGSDSLKDLRRWKDLKQILKLVQFVVIKRPGYALRVGNKKIRRLRLSEIDISSTDIRRRVKQGRTIKYLIPESVRKYIVRKKLYR